MNYLIGVDVGGTKIAYGLFDENKKLLAKRRRESDASLEPEAFFNNIIQDITQVLQDNQLTIDDVTGIGIGLPSYIDFAEGFILKTGSLPKLCNFPLGAYLKGVYHNNIKIVIDNDANSGAIAEYRHGVGSQFKHMVYCPMSTGISAGIIINGEIFRGSYGWAGESGHMLTTEQDRPLVCGCGNAGCFNSICSGKMIVHEIAHWIESGEKSSLPEMAGGIERITAEHINKAYELGDRLAIRAVDTMVHYMAIWLYNTYTLLNINCFVLSGGLLSMGDKLVGRIKKQFFDYNKNEYPVYFHEAILGGDSGIIGAMELLF